MNRRLHNPSLPFLFLFLFASLASADDDSRKIRADYPVTRLTDRVYVIYVPLDEPSKANRRKGAGRIQALGSVRVAYWPACQPGLPGSAGRGISARKKIRDRARWVLVNYYLAKRGHA